MKTLSGAPGDPGDLAEGGVEVVDVLEDAGDEDHRGVVGELGDRAPGDVGDDRHRAGRAAVLVDADVAAAVGAHQAGVHPRVRIADHDQAAAEGRRALGRRLEGRGALAEADQGGGPSTRPT